jgi:hypothetical protein
VITYNKEMPWQTYARLTVMTDDLDPVYVALHNSGWDESKLLRWCAAFVTYYHTGTACAVCDLEGDEFWKEIYRRYDTNPRSSERRHFRGEAGKKALRHWATEYVSPEAFMLACMKSSFMKTLEAGIPQIGAYFTWKVCDLREAVFGYSMDWAGAESHMLKTATNGLELIFPGEKYEQSVFKIVDAISDLDAPPQKVRKCGIAEAETVACGIRQYYLRGAPIGEDIVAKRDNLTGGGENAIHLMSCFPKVPKDADYVSYL